jgi:hypothetical protein
LVREQNHFRITVQPQVWVFPSHNSARTEEREGRCLRSPYRSRPCTGDRQLGFWGESTRLPEHPSGKHLLLPNVFILYGMTREVGQGSICFNFTVMLFMLLSVYFQLFRQFICLLYLYDSYVLCSHDPYCYGYI